jgi:hypothetical protein
MMSSVTDILRDIATAIHNQAKALKELERIEASGVRRDAEAFAAEEALTTAVEAERDAMKALASTPARTAHELNRKRLIYTAATADMDAPIHEDMLPALRASIESDATAIAE